MEGYDNADWIRRVRDARAGGGMAKVQLAHNVVDDRVDRSVDRYGHGIFTGVRRLKRLELAGQQPRRHEMTFAQHEPARDQIRRALEIDDADIGPSMDEDIAIGALQRGAGDHGMAAGLADPVDLVGDRLQPRPAIFIGEGLAGAHLGDVAQGVKPVAILVAPAQSLRQLFADGALA